MSKKNLDKTAGAFGNVVAFPSKTTLRVNATCEWIDASQFRSNPVNLKLYGKIEERDEEHLANLAKKIKKNGLHEPIQVYWDEETQKYIGVSGHHRFQVITGDFEYDEIPVIILDSADMPTNELEWVERIADANMRPIRTEYDCWTQCKVWEQAYRNEHGEKPNIKAMDEEFHRFGGFSYKKWLQVDQLKHGYSRTKDEWVEPREDLFENDFVTGKKLLSQLAGIQKTDHSTKRSLRDRPYIKNQANLITRPMIKVLLSECKRVMQNSINYKDPVSGVPYGKDLDASVLSGLLSGHVTNGLVYNLANDKGIIAIAPDGGSHFDVIAEPQSKTKNKHIEWEVKATRGDEWTSGKPKVGWNIVVSANNDFTEFFTALAYVQNNIWKGWKHTYRLTKDDLLVCKHLKILHGSMKTGKNGRAVLVKRPI